MQLQQNSLDFRRLLFRAEEVAKMTGLSRQAVYQRAAEGSIPCVRIGRSVRFPADALREWIDRMVVEQNGDGDSFQK